MFNKKELKMITLSLQNKLLRQQSLLGTDQFAKAKLEPGNRVHDYYELYKKVYAQWEECDED